MGGIMHTQKSNGRLHLVTALLAAALATATGCGGGGNASSGVDPDRPLSELDHDDLMAVCDATFDAEAADYDISDEDAKRYSCYWSAIWFRSEFPLLGANCDERALDCLQGDDSAGLFGGENEEGCEELRADESSDGSDLPECWSEISVGELEACYDAVAERVRDMADTISCSTPSDQVLLLPQECELLNERCPGVI